MNVVLCAGNKLDEMHENLLKDKAVGLEILKVKDLHSQW